MLFVVSLQLKKKRDRSYLVLRRLFFFFGGPLLRLSPSLNESDDDDDDDDENLISSLNRFLTLGSELREIPIVAIDMYMLEFLIF